MLRDLIRAVARRAKGTAAMEVAHGALQHAHWDRAARRWVTHEDDAEPARAA